jgi:hypothetical protein
MHISIGNASPRDVLPPSILRALRTRAQKSACKKVERRGIKIQESGVRERKVGAVQDRAQTEVGYSMLARREKIGYEQSRISWTPQEPLGPNTFAWRHGNSFAWWHEESEIQMTNPLFVESSLWPRSPSPPLYARKLRTLLRQNVTESAHAPWKREQKKGGWRQNMDPCPGEKTAFIPGGYGSNSAVSHRISGQPLKNITYGWVWQDKTKQSKARQDKTRQDKTRQDKTRDRQWREEG